MRFKINSIKIRLAIALILAIVTGIVLTGIGSSRLISPSKEALTLTPLELMSILTVFFMLILAVLFLCFPLIFHPITIAMRRFKTCYEKKDFRAFNPDDFPELSEFIKTTTDLLNYAEKERSLAEMIKKVSRERAQLAETDRMTGLFNKNYLMNFLSAELVRTRALGDELSVIMLDIDNFKNYNDTHGHPAGDEVLIRLSNLLIKNTREMDLCVRYGGEEFLLVLPKTPLQRAERLAERVRKAVQMENFKFEELHPGGQLTISVGVANFPVHATTTEQLIERADEALYVAKRTGKNRVSIYEPKEAAPEDDDDFQAGLDLQNPSIHDERAGDVAT